MSAFVKFGSDLVRQTWMMKGMLQASSKSFWSSLTSSSKDAIVTLAKNPSAKDGHTVIFDYSGNLVGRPVKGKATAFGKGEAKKKFNDKLTVARYRFPVDNGDAFDAVEIGDLSISQHQDSRTKLADLWIRVKDQTLYDSAQGNLGQLPSHIIDLVSTFDYNTLVTLETTIKSSVGFTTGGTRRPLDPYRMNNGDDSWLFVIDSKMAELLKQDPLYQTLVSNADVRGEGNRIIKGIIGKIGNLWVVESKDFFGDTDNVTVNNWNIEDTSVEISGLRRRDAAGLWTGQPGYVFTGDQFSRGIILGGGAMQLGFGKMPDYRFKSAQDFDITSESALEVWFETRKTKLVEEAAGDYEQAKVTNLDWGVVAVDVQVQ